MKPEVLVVIAAYSLTVIGLTEGIGVFSLTPASLLIGLPFTVTGVTSGTLAALGALKLLAATALALSYTGSSLGQAGEGQYGGIYGTGGIPSGGGGYRASYGGGGETYSHAPAESHYGGGPSPAYGGSHAVYRRSIDNNIGNLELYFHIINEVDANNCALRLICELEATKDKTKLDEDEKMILALFGPKPKEMPISALKTPSGPYHFAAFVGSSSSVAECGKFYSKCPYSGSQMMRALRTATKQ